MEFEAGQFKVSFDDDHEKVTFWIKKKPLSEYKPFLKVEIRGKETQFDASVDVLRSMIESLEQLADEIDSENCNQP